MLRLGKDVLCVRELPTVHGVGGLDLGLGLVVLLLPAAEDNNRLVDLLGSAGLEENLLDIDLVADFLAYFCRNSLKNEFKFIFILVNVSGDGPDELQTVQKRRQGFLDH